MLLVKRELRRLKPRLRFRDGVGGEAGGMECREEDFSSLVVVVVVAGEPMMGGPVTTSPPIMAAARSCTAKLKSVVCVDSFSGDVGTGSASSLFCSFDVVCPDSFCGWE